MLLLLGCRYCRLLVLAVRRPLGVWTILAAFVSLVGFPELAERQETYPLASSPLLLLLILARRGGAVLAHAVSPAVFFVPCAERLAAEHQIVILDHGGGHPRLLRRLQLHLHHLHGIEACHVGQVVMLLARVAAVRLLAHGGSASPAGSRGSGFG